MARRVRQACLAAIAVLYVVSIPWYREGGSAPGLWLGLPDWVAVALVCYVAVAVLNAVAWLATEVPEATPHPRRRRAAGGEAERAGAERDG